MLSLVALVMWCLMRGGAGNCAARQLRGTSAAGAGCRRAAGDRGADAPVLLETVLKDVTVLLVALVRGPWTCWGKGAGCFVVLVAVLLGTPSWCRWCSGLSSAADVMQNVSAGRGHCWWGVTAALVT